MKDTFKRLKFQVSEKLSKFEAFLNQREIYEKSDNKRDVLEKKKVEEKLEVLNKEIKNGINDLEKELKAQRNKKKFYDIEEKEQILELLKKKIKILEKKYNGEDVEDELNNNEQSIQKLEDFLKQSKINENSEQRELYEEEKNKMDEWNERKNDQDKRMEEIRGGLKILKIEAEKAGEAIKETGKKIKQTGSGVDRTTVKVKSQNERVKELVNKIRSSDKICVDLVLILILFGLVCVLYSIIKHKY